MGNTLGFMNVVLGWKMDVLLAIIAIVIIGFAVDYVLHLGHMLAEARAIGLTSRVGKVKYVMEMMGI